MRSAANASEYHPALQSQRAAQTRSGNTTAGVSVIRACACQASEGLAGGGLKRSCRRGYLTGTPTRYDAVSPQQSNVTTAILLSTSHSITNPLACIPFPKSASQAGIASHNGKVLETTTPRHIHAASGPERPGERYELSTLMGLFGAQYIKS